MQHVEKLGEAILTAPKVISRNTCVTNPRFTLCYKNRARMLGTFPIFNYYC